MDDAPAKRPPGNHGQVIPRDRDLLHGLYWNDNKTLPEIGTIYGVGHKSVERVMRELAIPRRRRGISPDRPCKTVGCKAPVMKIKHATNGSIYGRYCETHRRQHYTELAYEYRQRDDVKERIKQQNDRAYYSGPIKPAGEQQWISKGKVLLRNVRRLCVTPRNLEASQYRTVKSTQVPISPT